MLFEEGTKKMFNTYALEQRIAAHMGAVSAPGAAVAVISGADVVYARGFGVTSVEDGAPVTPHTLFCIGSTTKALTATLIMRLVDAGTLDLDEPVTTYLPWFIFHKEPAAAGAVTLRRLLSFTAGLPAGGSEFGPPGDEEMGRFVREVIQRYELVAPPGTVLLYSNTSLSLVGHIAEAVTGRPYRDLMRDLVFEPLVMRRSTFDRAVAMTYPLALPHERDADGALRVTHRLSDHAAGDPSGFALSTVLDLANFAIMQINGGDSPVGACSRQGPSPRCSTRRRTSTTPTGTRSASRSSFPCTKASGKYSAMGTYRVTIACSHSTPRKGSPSLPSPTTMRSTLRPCYTLSSMNSSTYRRMRRLRRRSRPTQPSGPTTRAAI